MTNASDARAKVLAKLLTDGIGKPEFDAADNNLEDITQAILEDFQEGDADNPEIDDVTYDEVMGYIEDKHDRQVLFNEILAALTALHDAV